MGLIDTLSYTPNELKFGTSGLRGLVSDMTDLECYINTKAFLLFCKEKYPNMTQAYVAGDLRDSTPRIVSAVVQAIVDAGLKPTYLGLMPTPVMALRGFTDHAASVMVTGSHIPADRNGIKYYKPDKELMKYDEAPLLELVAKVREQEYASERNAFNNNGMLVSSPKVTIDGKGAIELYKDHLTPLIKGQLLKGLTIAFYEHSAVGRDLIPEIIAEAGAKVIRFGRSDTFIPVDTENVTLDLRNMFKEYLENNPGIDAIVSTDGDSDRPLFVDGRGVVRGGDILGLVSALMLHIEACAYPVSSSDVLDANFDLRGVTYVRTKIGSPYVIDAVDNYGKEIISSGWEVNGGFMVGENVSFEGMVITPLMTRDATLPILGALLASAMDGVTPYEYFESIEPKRIGSAGLVDMEDFDDCVAVTESMKSDKFDLSKYFTTELGFGAVKDIDTTDGVRIIFDNGDVAHVRGSGNAPQLRIYSLANTAERAQKIVDLCVSDGGIFAQIANA